MYFWGLEFLKKKNLILEQRPASLSRYEPATQKIYSKGVKELYWRKAYTLKSKSGEQQLLGGFFPK